MSEHVDRNGRALKVGDRVMCHVFSEALHRAGEIHDFDMGPADRPGALVLLDEDGFVHPYHLSSLQLIATEEDSGVGECDENLLDDTDDVCDERKRVAIINDGEYAPRRDIIAPEEPAVPSIEVQRYADPWRDIYDKLLEDKDPDGPWCKHEDIAPLLEELDDYRWFFGQEEFWIERHQIFDHVQHRLMQEAIGNPHERMVGVSIQNPSSGTSYWPTALSAIKHARGLSDD